jgi:hypothetical protein
MTPRYHVIRKAKSIQSTRKAMLYLKFGAGVGYFLGCWQVKVGGNKVFSRTQHINAEG